MHPTAGSRLKEFSVTVDADRAEALADALLEAGALSVSTEDADAGTQAEQALFGEPGFEPERAAWPQSRLVVLLGEHTEPAPLLAEAGGALFTNGGLPKIAGLRDVENADWVRLTQTQFEPVEISPTLWIVPSWHEPPAQAKHIIHLDPGVAFGTGSHPTTQLCLKWLEENLQAGGRVLDYGCGSGVLAIAAGLLGASEVVGVDIDPQAVSAARDNARTNLPENFWQGRSKKSAQFLLPDALDSAMLFDVVVANILANPLQVLAPALIARMKPGGALVLSGILTRQTQALVEAFEDTNPNLKAHLWREQDGWVCIAAQLGSSTTTSST